MRTPAGSEYDGLFDFDLAPHTRGVLEAWDDPFVREIHLCWATRNMKTTTFISLMIFAAVNMPRPMAFGSCDEMSIDRTIDEQIYPMLEACEPTRLQLPPPAKRGRDSIRLDRCRIRKAFGGSKSSVAGYPACYVFLNEVDKWPHRKSSEADTVRGFRQRAKGYPFESKILTESTPGEIESSRIWSIVRSENTDLRRYWVPCPHCRTYQTLVFEQVKWAKNAKGKSDLLLAEQTAWYECLHCQKKILNEDRPLMMRRGKWISEGQSIDTAGKITGTPKIRSPIVAFAYLGTEYSLLISGWGQQAADFLQCGRDPEKLRDFMNSNRALPWDPKPVKLNVHELAARLGSPETRGRAPAWSAFLTQGVDVQEGGDIFKWQTSAWGRHGRGGLLDWGTLRGFDELERHLAEARYPHADGGNPVSPKATFIDSGDGNVTEEVYAFCRRMCARGVRCFPCKGSSTSGFPAAFKTSAIEEDERPGSRGKKIQSGGVMLFLVNTDRSQRWLQKHLEADPDPTDVARYTIPEEAQLDFELLDELLNEFRVDGRWQKRGCNDFRDCTRYAWAAANLITNHGKYWDVLPDRRPSATVAESAPAGERRESSKNPFTNGGGRAWRNS